MLGWRNNRAKDGARCHGAACAATWSFRVACHVGTRAATCSESALRRGGDCGASRHSRANGRGRPRHVPSKDTRSAPYSLPGTRSSWQRFVADGPGADPERKFQLGLPCVSVEQQFQLCNMILNLTGALVLMHAYCIRSNYCGVIVKTGTRLLLASALQRFAKTDATLLTRENPLTY